MFTVKTKSWYGYQEKFSYYTRKKIIERALLIKVHINTINNKFLNEGYLYS